MFFRILYSYFSEVSHFNLKLTTIIRLFLFVDKLYSRGNKYRLKERNSCYYSIQTLLSSSLLSKNLKIKIYKTIILQVVLYGCETWFLIFREECRLRIFENRNLSRMFGPMRDENEEWRRFHIGELHNLYRSPNTV